MSTDTAEYYCLVNDRHSPEAIIDLLVQGKRISDFPLTIECRFAGICLRAMFVIAEQTTTNAIKMNYF